ncbi:MAG: DnaJ domain-containing protein [Phycisphaeraceae bacterium]|nr:DnaJ domain-containing protein [Phycisphaeraceae bacterium]
MAIKFEDYYESLGVIKSATADEIKRAYRTLARKFHPDVNKDTGAQGTFQKATEAYEVLKDPEKRQRYDQYGSQYKAGQEFTPPSGFGGFNFSGAGGQTGGFNMNAGGQFSDFFDSMFGQMSQAQGSRRQTNPFAGQARPRASASGPANAPRGGGCGSGNCGSGSCGSTAEKDTVLDITLEEAYHGGSRQVTIQSANGSTSKLDVKIPAGAADGAKIRLKGQGTGGQDLFLKLKIAKHALYELAGVNMVVDVRLSPWEAALGAKVPVDTLDGPITMTIPAGTCSGARMRIREKGLRKPKNQGRGDLFARIKIVVPKELTEDEKQLLEQLQEKSEFDPRQS